MWELIHTLPNPENPIILSFSFKQQSDYTGYGWLAIIWSGIVIFGDRDLIAVTIPNDLDLIDFFS